MLSELAAGFLLLLDLKLLWNESHYYKGIRGHLDPNDTIRKMSSCHLPNPVGNNFSCICSFNPHSTLVRRHYCPHFLIRKLKHREAKETAWGHVVSAELQSEAEGHALYAGLWGGGPAKLEIWHLESWTYSSHWGGLKSSWVLLRHMVSGWIFLDRLWEQGWHPWDGADSGIGMEGDGQE